MPEDQRPRRETHLDYDTRGRMVARVSEDYHDTVHYDDRDQLTLIERVPTEVGRTKGLQPSTLRFEYDQAGRLIGEGDGDRTGRLKRHWPAPMREEWFGYDEAANRILPGNDSSPRHMTVGDNRQREVDGYRYRYDAWGNTIQRTTPDEEQYFEYDSDNRLVRAQVYCQHQPISDSRYHYDPLGRRIRKSVTYHDPLTATSCTKNTHFLWQGLRLLSETQHQPEQQPTTRLYCYEQDSYAPLARIDTAGDDLNSPQVYYFHTDVTGTPKEVTDTDGQIVWQADYRAWGEIDLYRVHQIDQPLRFQGQYADDETGLYYTTFRYYDPHAGRFTTQDPIGLAGGWNLHQYAPNPTGWVDPLGLKCWSAAKKDYWKDVAKRELKILQEYILQEI